MLETNDNPNSVSDNFRVQILCLISDFPLRFQRKVRFEPATGCWIWTAATNSHLKHKQHKYGIYSADATPSGRCYAHRFSYQFAHGSIPQGLDVDHACANKLCVNPAHLRAVTHKENCQTRSKRQRVPGSKRWLAEQRKQEVL